MMLNGLCHTGTWGSLGSMGVWGWVGMILNLIFWFGLFAGLTLMLVRSMSRAWVPASGELPNPKEMLQAQYARGEITREEYQLRKQNIG
jgi:uncharacterized membrane protein